MQLNGCNNNDCHDHIFLPSDKARECPKCGTARYDANGQPREVAFYFPLTPKLRALLKLKGFRKLLNYEYQRPRAAGIMSDLFDSPEWAKVMGPSTRRLTRIALVGCVDGIPCFRIGGLSLMPSEFFIANLPPEHRTKAGNMIMHMLLDSTLSSKAMRKYYQFAAKFEINQLRNVGVEGVRIIVLANTLDTKGLYVCILITQPVDFNLNEVSFITLIKLSHLLLLLLYTHKFCTLHAYILCIPSMCPF